MKFKSLGKFVPERVALNVSPEFVLSILSSIIMLEPVKLIFTSVWLVAVVERLIEDKEPFSIFERSPFGCVLETVAMYDAKSAYLGRPEPVILRVSLPELSGIVTVEPSLVTRLLLKLRFKESGLDALKRFVKVPRSPDTAGPIFGPLLPIQ